MSGEDDLESSLFFTLGDTTVIARPAFVIVLCLGLAACADKQPAVTASSASQAPAVAEDGTPLPPTAAQLEVLAAGTALPGGYRIDNSRTMLFGTDERWLGRLSYTAAGSADEVFDFLHREMPNFGWIEISAMRSDTSLLTFSSPGTSRIATVTIRRSAPIGGCQVDMVVAPQSAAN